MKRFDLMMGINTRGTFMVSKYCIPHLKKAANPHILMLSPPLDMKQKWFEHSTAYTMAKFGMSMCVLGLSGELKSAGVAVNALWPRTTIATAAVGNLLGGDAMMRASRTPEIMGDAAHAILTRPSREFTGQFCIDDKVLYASGVRDFEHYRVDPLGAVDVGFLRPRRRRAAARRHRAGAALGGRGADVALERLPADRFGARHVNLRKWTASSAVAICVAALAGASVYFRPDRAIRVATGFVAHNVCSKTFVSGLDPQTVFAETTERDGIRRLRRVLGFQLDRTGTNGRCVAWRGCSAAAPCFMTGSVACCSTDRASLIFSRATSRR